MKIKSLTLKNWRKHRDTSITFTGDVVGLVGPNGCAKSSVIAAIQYLLLGETDRLKTRNLTWGADSGFVEGTIEHEGRTFLVRRDTSSAKCYLKFEDEPANKARRSAEAVNEALRQTIGISPQLFDSHVLIRQGKIDLPLSMRSAELAKYMHTLFGTDRAESIRAVLQRSIDVHVVPEFTGLQLEQLRVNLKESTERLEEADKTLTFLDQRLAEQDVSTVQARVQAFHTAARLRPMLDNWQQLEARVAAELQQLHADLAAVNATYTKLDANVKEFQPTADEFVRRMALAQQADNLVQQVQAAQARLEFHKLSISNLESSRPVEPTIAASVVDQIHGLEASITNARSTISKLQAIGSVCPTCEQVVPDKDSLITKYTNFITQSMPTLTELRAAELQRANTIKAYELAVQKWNADLAAARISASAAADELARLTASPSFPVSAAEKKQMEDFLSEFTAIKRQRDEHGNVLTAGNARTSSLTTQLNDTRVQIKAATDQMPTMAVSAEEYEALNKKMSEYQALVDDRLRWVAVKQERAGQVAKLTADIEIRQSEFARIEPIRRIRNILERTRDILHRDNLPRLVALTQLKSLNAALSSKLAELAFPYSAKLTGDDMSFVCTTSDSQVFPANELSGGEKMLFCIAYYLAVNRLFAANLGFLVLDEPTVSVDKDNVQRISEVLEHIRAHIRARGVQIIVVTHEDRLHAAFDQVIDVAAITGAQ